MNYDCGTPTKAYDDQHRDSFIFNLGEMAPIRTSKKRTFKCKKSGRVLFECDSNDDSECESNDQPPKLIGLDGDIKSPPKLIGLDGDIKSKKECVCIFICPLCLFE